jgi:glucose-1-phosphate cytidylyltransferase
MKTFILCGGKGTRLDYESSYQPKAMIKIGKDPIILHLIKSLANQNLSVFVLCLGYKKDIIIDYFLNSKKNKPELLINKKKFIKVSLIINKKKIFLYLVDTGLESGTGWRIKMANNIIKNNENILMTYCDGLSNINIKKLILIHNNKKKPVTITAVQPKHRYGILKIENNLVKSFNNENPKQNIRINGGYFIIQPDILKIIKSKKSYWEADPIKYLVKKKLLSCYLHNGFWASLDTQKEKKYFNLLYKNKKMPWLNVE